MITAVDIVLTAITIAVALPVLFFVGEVTSGWWAPGKRDGIGGVAAGPIVVLIPAHNEGHGLLPTLSDVKGQLRLCDRVLVVADNCSDDTAAVAANAGSEVIERNDPTRIGKGHALDFGIRALEAAPPDILIIVDADCRLDTGAIGQLAMSVATSEKPAQACYLMRNPSAGGSVAEFAWRIKNQLRPLGLARWGMPCQLAGTGMAFPWRTARSAPFASGSLVEDLELGLVLAAKGEGALFCPTALVWSQFAASEVGARTQRTRWEQGHFQTIRELFWPTFRAGMRRRDGGAIALALDLSVPPLSFLASLVLVALLLSVTGALLGTGLLPLWIALATLMAFAFALITCWSRVGQDSHTSTAAPFASAIRGLQARPVSPNLLHQDGETVDPYGPQRQIAAADRKCMPARSCQ